MFQKSAFSRCAVPFRFNKRHRYGSLHVVVIGALLFHNLLGSQTASAQTKLKFSAITPGSEGVQLVYNGDFQFQGPLINSSHPSPIGWSRQADIFADPGTNMVQSDSGIVARALVNGGAGVCKYERVVTLEPNTAYMLSGYLWNMGDAANHVSTVVDLNDAFQEPQLTLYFNEADADKGYFVYRSFNTADTGSNVTLRVFYDSPVGSMTAPGYFPVGAQWDNIAITKVSEFATPQASGSGANLRPFVSITSPADGTNMIFQSTSATVTITASASDSDGTISKVEFFAGANKIGEATNSPYSILWSGLMSGSYQLTAVATDNGGATTRSAPVSVIVSVPLEPIALTIQRLGSNASLLWSTSVLAASLQWSSNLNAATVWQLATNPVSVISNRNVVTVPIAGAQKYFRLGPGVDANTLNRKLLMGYQGWFVCPNDGSPVNQWIHWFRNNSPTATNATVDFWPDISELEPDELFATSMTLTNGTPAKVYSAYKQKTVVRHFKWMKDNNLDGVFLQRFSSELSSASFFALRNQVAANVRTGAETYGRVFSIMYDISGTPAASLISRLTNDWLYLVNTMQITNSSRYVRHKGKPVVAIWGFGFTDRPGTPQDAQTVISYFKNAGCTVMGGVPTYWRTLTADSQTNTEWTAVYRSFDIISPWAVGRFGNLSGADNFKTSLIVPDLADTRSHNLDYMPVVFPGFSWHNLLNGPLNQIPRNGGSFYWRQVYNAISAGCTMIYGAMFDEMDEGTAMLKMAPTPNELPVQGTFVPLNIDGQLLPSDWYLRVADQASRMLRGDIPLQSQMPITP